MALRNAIVGEVHEELAVCVNCQDIRTTDEYITCDGCSSPLCDTRCLEAHLEQSAHCRSIMEMD